MLNGVVSTESKLTVVLFLSTSTIGVGYLSLPYRVINTGLFNILLIMLLTILASYYSAKLILTALQAHPTAYSYGNLMRRVFRNEFSGTLCEITLILFRFVCTVSYLSLSSKLCWTVLSGLLSISDDYQSIVLILTKTLLSLFVLVLFCRPTLQETKPLSLIAHIFLTVFTAVLFYQMKDRLSRLSPSIPYNIISFPKLDSLATFADCALAFFCQSTMVFILRSFEQEPQFHQKVSVS